MDTEKFKNQKFIRVVNARKASTAGFTLIELLIVVGILATLSAVIIIVLNPSELFKQARDSKRLTEIATLKKALNVASLELPTSAQGSAQTIYISVPDAGLSENETSACPGMVPPSGWQYHCVSSANLTRTDGSGWLPVNFASLSSESPVSALPIDPVNTTSSGMYYAYIPGGSYALSASLESLKYLQGVARNDGGSDPSRIEVGTDISLWEQASGPLGYWKFDENVSSPPISIGDSSGGGHAGAGSPAGASIVSLGKAGNAVSLSGVAGGYINIAEPQPLFATNTITMAAWIYINNAVAPGALYGDFSGANTVEYSFEIAPGGTAVDFYTNHQGVTPNSRSTPFPGGFSLGTWTHLAVTWDGNTDGDNLKVYINGALAATNNLYGIMPSPSDSTYRIGKRADNTNPFKGKIDELRVYNRALSAGEIWALYDSTK